MTHLEPGIVLRKRYEIIGLIGEGGMGAVYLAEDNRLAGRRCAIKEQTVDNNLSEVARIQFQQEASILAQLDHPGLPKVSDYFSDEKHGCDYLVMDYVPGKNLEQVMQTARREGQSLTEEAILDWVNQLCDVLIHLHACQPIVVHRDIKPANIKIMPNNRLKLVDFGLAKPFDPSDPRTITGLQGLGSLPYTPIEQYVGHQAHTDARADLYALGATCYHLVTNEIPPSAHDRFLDPEVLFPPKKFNPRLSDHFNEVILWAMRLHPNERPVSVATWHAVLTGRKTIAEITSNQTEPFSQENTGHNQPPNPVWYISFRENGFLIGIALILLIFALVITFSF